MQDTDKYFKYKILAAFIATIIGSFSFLFYFFYQEQAQRLAEIQQTYYEKINNSFFLNEKKHLKEHYTKLLDELIDDRVLEMVALGQRDELLASTQELYAELHRDDPYVKVLHFHKADGTTLLRLHNVDFYGDAIADKRALVRFVHSEQIQVDAVDAYELGESGLYYRIITSLFYKERYVGAVEIGICPQKLVQAVTHFNQIEGLLRLEHSDNCQDRDVNIKNRSYLSSIDMQTKSMPKETLVKNDKEFFAIYSFDIEDFSGKYIGEFVFFQDLQKYYTNYNSSFSKMLEAFVFVVVLIFLFSWYIFSHYRKREEFDKQKMFSILNAQENIVVLSLHGKKLLTCNSAFLKFFGFDSLEDFSQKYECICDLFLVEDGYLQPQVEGRNWIYYIKDNPQKSHLAKMKQGTQVHIFRVSVRDISGAEQKAEEFVVTFEDITQEKQLLQKLEDERELFSDGPVLTIEWSPESNWPIRYISKNCQEVLGYSVEQMMRDDFVYAELIHPDDLARVFEEVSGYIQSHAQTYEQSYRLLLSDGSYRWFYDFTKLVWDVDGRLLSIRGYMFDQSELKASEEIILKDKQRLANIIDGTNVGTWEWNVQTGETIFNEKWAEIVGYTLEEISPTTIETWVKFAHPQDLKDSERSLQDCLSKKAPYYEAKCRMLHRDGSYVWVYDRGSVSKWDENGEALIMSGTHTNIDAEERLKKELVELNRELKDASEAKSQFLANMSHEIRTPMNAIVGLSELMKDTPLSAKQLDLLTKINGSSKMLLRIINDILDFSKLEAGKLELEEFTFEVESIFAQLRVLFGTKSFEQGLELYFYKKNNLPALLIGDELRIAQVLTNLLSNAIKFTHEGVVIFKMELKERVSNEKALIAFSVKDSGIGMSKEEQAKLFKAFSQADVSTTRKYGGTGLGLMISSKIVEAMGSKIEVESEPNVGSTFSFDLALNVASWQENKPLIAQRAYKILIVDDVEISREILRDMLDGFGCVSSEACDGLDAIEMVVDADAKDEPYDFILLDWLMPRLDGKAALQRLKQMHKEGELSHLPSIIMISAHTQEEVEIGALEIESFLPKPLTSSTLFDALVDTQKGAIVKQAAKTEDTQIDLSDLHILLVEDNEINQEVAMMMLERVGARVSVANNGQEGVDTYLANPQSYSLILMDLQMPVMSGYEATALIRQESKEIPIIALTAAAMVEDRQKVLDAGMNEHLSKPIDIDELYAKILKYSHGIDEVATQKMRSQSANMEILDFAFLEKTLSSRELIERLLQKFLQQLQGEFGSIVQSVKDSDAEAATLIHALKGVGGNLGARELFFASAQIDAAYKKGDAPTPEQIEALQDALKRLKERLLSLEFATQQSSAVDPSSDEESEAFVQKMLTKLEASEIVSHEEREKLLICVSRDLDEKESLMLKNALDEFEFDEALRILKKGGLGDE